MTSAAPVVAPISTVLRDWLRTNGPTGERVYVGGLPQSPTLPAITLTKVAGSYDTGVQIDTIDFNVWAETGSTAEAISAQLRTLLIQTDTTTVLGAADGITVRYGGVIEPTLTATYLPDPDTTEHCRYLVTGQLVTIPQPS